VNIYYEAAMWIGMALLAASVSIRIAVPVALVGIVIGALGGNLPGIKEHLTQADFVTFLAGVGSIMLTFLAGAEIDPVSLSRHWKASISISVVVMPPLLRGAIAHLGHRVSEPEVKLILAVLFVLGGLATQARSEAVLPAYLIGLVVAGVFLHDRVLMDRLRSIAFAFFTPFFFLQAGTLISASTLVTGAGVIVVLLLVKLGAKGLGVWPTASVFGLPRRERAYTTLSWPPGSPSGRSPLSTATPMASSIGRSTQKCSR
jgi:Kef-type K+ transport system membrane component KefB